MPLAFGPLSRRPVARLNDLPLVATMAAGVGAVIIYTVEIIPASGSAVYAATEQYNTLPTDSRPNLPFHGTLAKAPTFRRSIVDGASFGRMSSGLGEIALNNPSGEYDSLLASPLNGARVIVRLGWRGISFDRFVTIFDGQADDPEVDYDQVVIPVKDDNKRLEIPVQPNVYGGTGGIDGDANVKGKRKPLCLGTPPNVTLQLIDAANLVFQGHDGAMGGWAHIYDRGIELTATGADYASFAALVAATIAPGRWASCNALGVIRIGAKPDGTVTGTPSGGATSNGLVAGSPTVGAALTDTASLVHYLLTISSANVVVDAGSVLAVKSAQPASIGYFVGPDEAKTLRQAIDELMDGIGGWGGFRRDRTLELGIFTLPSSSPAGDFTEKDWFSIRRVPLPSSASPPPFRIRAAYSLDWTIQADLDTTVDATTQTLRKDPYSIAKSTDSVTSAAVRAAYPNGVAQDPDVIRSFFVNAFDAVAECNRRIVLYGGAARSLFRVELPTDAFAVAISATIRITDTSATPRFGLASGKYLSVVEVEDQPDDSRVVIEGFG